VSQLALTWSAPDRDRMAWGVVLDVIQQVVVRASLKEVSYRLGVEPSALANAIKERDRHYVRAEWLAPLMEIAAANGLAVELACALVAPAKLVVVPAQPLTSEQRLARLEAAIARLGPGVEKLIKSEADVT
jgi:hypothetical protein